MSTAQRTFFTLNLNTLLNGVITAIAIAVLTNGYSINKEVIELSGQIRILNKQVAEVVPRAELDLRFKAIDTQLIELRNKIQSSEVDILKLREKRY